MNEIPCTTRNTMRKQQGNASVEYVMVCLILIVALFSPVLGGDQSVMGLFMDRLAGFHENSSFLLSLP